jgi:CBS domain-containing protein
VEIRHICTRKLYVVEAQQPLAEAVREMHRHHVGAAVVAERRGGKLVPIGIVTDRDVLCRQLARKADLFALTVADVMTHNLLTLSESSGLAEAIRLLRARNVRRAPVISSDGDLVGIVSLDDLLPAVASELSELAALLGSQARREAHQVGA